MKPPDWPRAMKRATAAAYCDLAPIQFERAVAEGTLPLPMKLSGVDLWSRALLDQHLEMLSGEKAPDWRLDAPLYASR